MEIKKCLEYCHGMLFGSRLKQGCDRKFSSKQAFTLAEVLITLGIIGVVAAMTMPVLIQNYQKKELVIRLKKAVSVTEQSVRMFMYDQNLEIMSNDDWDNYNKAMSKYVKGVNASMNGAFYKEFSRLEANALIYSTSDGFCLFSQKGMMIVDVNCDKAPNLPGRDRFMFLMKSNGYVNYMSYDATLDIIMNDLRDINMSIDEVPVCAELVDKIFSKMLDKMCGNDENCRAVSSAMLKEPDTYTELSTFGMRACFAKVVSDGWKMNY